MYLLQWLEGDKTQYVGMFESVESGRTFMQKVPGYQYDIVEEDGFSFDEEMIEYDKLPDIMMIEHNGYRIPVSRFSFEGDIMVIWVELDYLDGSKTSNTLLHGALRSSQSSVIATGATRVDAYSINNEDVEEYILKREGNYRKCVELLDQKGYECYRAGFGSEDGEYLLVRKKSVYAEDSDEGWRFFTHMDPSFLEMDIEAEICEFLKEMDE